MPKHISLATVVDKNKIASPDPWLMLLEVEVRDQVSGALLETQRLVRDEQNLEYQGNTYTAAKFDFSIEEIADEVPEVSLSIQDPSGTVMDKAEQHRGGVGWRVRMIYVATANLDQPPEVEELVYIIGSRVQDYVIEFTLGARNPLAQRFPGRLQWRDRCAWVYKGPECGYTGSMPTCDFTLQGDNGCSAHNNTEHFGGFPGIRPRS